jgi:copper transport protein
LSTLKNIDESMKLIPGAVQVISDTGSRVDTGAVLRPGGTVSDLPLPARLPRDPAPGR